eukprot:6834533-Karenia_brevis.AAC.1
MTTLTMLGPEMLKNLADNMNPSLLHNLWHAARVGMPDSSFIDILNDKTSGYQQASDMCIR